MAKHTGLLFDHSIRALCPEGAVTYQPRASPWETEGPHYPFALKGRYKRPPMSQSLAKNLIHLIYSTKPRTPCLPSAVLPGLFAYKAGILKHWQSPALVIGGVADHVHVLFCLSKNHALARVVEAVK